MRETTSFYFIFQVPVYVPIKEGDKVIRVHKSFKTVHHLTITAESGPCAGQYLTHAVLESGTGVAQAEEIYQVLQEYNSTKTLMAVACDNTAVNTGHNHGVVSELEKLLKRKLHKIGCLLHFNELPLRQVIRVLDGDTLSGFKWAGPICSKARFGVILVKKYNVFDQYF